MKNQRFTQNGRQACRLLFCVLLILFVFLLPSCASIDRDDAELEIQTVHYDYHPETDITSVTCEVVISNETIYNIRSFDVDLGVYINGERVQNEPYTYTHRIKHSQTERMSISFTAPGEVDQVGLVTWTPQFETFWKTYMNWILIAIVLAVASLAIWIWNEFF